MKKIFTLLFAVGMLSVAQAQYDQRSYPQNDQRNYQQNDQWKNQHDQRDLDRSYGNGTIFNNDDRFGNKNFSFDRGRDMEIARINQKYEFKTQMVMRNFFLSWYEKKRQIRFLQDQRQREISMVYDRWNGRRGRFDDHGYRSGNGW